MNTAELELQRKVFSTFDDPLAFALMCWPWGKEGTRFEDFPAPDEWQTDLMIGVRDQIRANPNGYQIRESTASGHGVGKGALQSIITIWAMATRPYLAGVTTANTGAQLRSKTWREVKLWLSDCLVGHWFEWTATRLCRKGFGDEWAVFALTNNKDNSESFAGLHGRHVLINIDECSNIDDSIIETLEGAMTTPRAMWFNYGNPTRNTGAFRDMFGKFKHRWNTRNVDARTARAATIHPENVRKMERDIKDYGIDSDYVKVRILGQFPARSSNQFISIETVRDAIERTVEVSPYAVRVMGVDVARYGDDQSAIAKVHGRKLYPIETLRSMDTMTVANWVAQTVKSYRPDVVYVDAVGIGSGVVDRLLQLQVNVIEVHGGASPEPENKDTLLNKRVECWWAMREWLKGADIPNDQELFDELTNTSYEVDKRRMMIKLTSKEDMRSKGLPSPDRADALSYCFAYDHATINQALSHEPEVA